MLQWNGTRREALDLADSAYTSLLAVRVGASLSQLEAAEPALVAKILGLLTALDAARLRRALLAPEKSSRLLLDHPGQCDDRDLWQYLADVLEIETARLSPIAVQPSTTGPLGTRGSALGDLVVNDAGEMVVSQPPLAGLLIDADSPAAVCFDGSSLHDGSMRLQHYRD